VAAGIRSVMRGERAAFAWEYPCHSPVEQRWFVMRVTRFAAGAREAGGGATRVAVAHENITALKHREELARANEEIRQRNRDLETLLYVASHDLREPLRAIENFSRMVSDRYRERLDEKGRDFLQRVVRAAGRMNRLLEEILQLSRAQRMEAPAEVIPARLLVHEALGLLAARISETEARVRVLDDLPDLYVNATWATQAIYNLLLNALKFTRPGEVPEVEVGPFREGGQIGLAIRDRGPGIAPEHAERIFDLFQRAVGQEIEGTGAGLAIVRQIAERHGGRSWVLTRKGGGSEFFLTFGAAATTEAQPG
jgi:signal transduction histidine kinase